MKLLKIKNSTFHRIGNRGAHYFDEDHFMGRSSLSIFPFSRSTKKVNKFKPPKR